VDFAQRFVRQAWGGLDFQCVILTGTSSRSSNTGGRCKLKRRASSMSAVPSAWTAVAATLISTLTTSAGSLRFAPACVENSPGRRGERGCSISVGSG
jgi:hypothetical protein